ncbi:MAG: hypothetical protein ACI8WB_004285 [Phenylobacterium sp.]|jgi:hypothetical protein
MTNSSDTMSGEELGNKLLQSVKEMKAGQIAQITKITANPLTQPSIPLPNKIHRHPDKQ